MNSITAASVQKLSYQDRLPLVLRIRQASMNPMLSAQQRTLYRLAARFIRGNMDSPAYDMLARLQVLEGVSGIVTPKPMVAGPWSRNPRQGIKAAQDHFAGTGIDPEWFSRDNTGMISKVRGMLRQEFSKWTRGKDVHFSPDDILQNGLMGLNKDGMEQMSHGPLFLQFGALNKGVRKAILDGKASPTSIAGIIGKFFTQKVSDQFKMIDRSHAPSEDASGRNILEQQPQGTSDPMDVLADALSDPRNPIRKLILTTLERSLGGGAWAEIGMAYLTALANGEQVNKSEMAAQYNMASGTFSKILREKVHPALKAIQQDQRIQGLLEDYADRMSRQARRNHPR